MPESFAELQEVSAAAAWEGDATASPQLPARGVSSPASGQTVPGSTNTETSTGAADLGPGRGQPLLLLFQM